jgi:uncharacterized membrane protein
MSWSFKFRIVLLLIATLLAILALFRTSWIGAVPMILVMVSLLIQLYQERRNER